LLGTRKIKKTTTAGEVSGRTGKEGQEDGKHTDHRWQTGRCNVVLSCTGKNFFGSRSSSKNIQDRFNFTAPSHFIRDVVYR